MDSYDPDEKFYYAIHANDVECLHRLIKDGASPNTVFSGMVSTSKCGRPRSWTGLHLCCEKGHFECAKELLTAGADPNSYDGWTQTPLIYAIRNLWYNLIDLLLASGADPDWQDRKGRAPLHLCVEVDSAGDLPDGKPQGYCCEKLLQVGANPNLVDALGRTPVWLGAAKDGQVSLLAVLLASPKCKLNMPDVGHRRTALQAAIVHTKKDRLQYVRMLLDAGCDVNSRDARNHTAFMTTMYSSWSSGERVSSEDLEICTLILQHGYDINHVAPKHNWLEFGGSTLSMAVDRGATVLVELLLANGADPDVADESNNTAMMYAVRRNRLSTACRLLLKNPRLEYTGVLRLGGPNSGDPGRPCTPFQASMFLAYMDFAMLLVRVGCNLSDERYLWTNENIPESLVVNFEFWAWLRDHVATPESLLDICRKWLRRRLGSRIEQKLEELPLPDYIRNVVLLKDLLDVWM